MDRPAAWAVAVLAAVVMVVVLAWSGLGTSHGPHHGGEIDGPVVEHDHGTGAVEPPELPYLAPYDLEEPRQWLRSVSTAPRHPRLAAADDDTDPPDDLLVWTARIRVDGAGDDGLTRTRETDGIALAAEVRLTQVPVVHRRGRDDLVVAFVDPTAFRTFTPRLTAEAETLWQALEDGGALVTHEAAREHGIALGEEVRVGRFLRSVHAEVAGTVSLGRADVADVVLHTAALADVRRDTDRLLLVGVERPDAVGELIARLERRGVGEQVTAIPSPLPYEADLVGDHEPTAQAFEPFTFSPGEGGRIVADPAWVDAHITTVDLPILGETRCHRRVVPQLEAALAELVEQGLADLLDPADYAGCWVPRHIGWDAGRGISMHAWGLAFDVNVSTNAYGDPPRLDPRVVKIFEDHGFNWGGRWRVPDGMHFELGELIEP